MVSEGRQDIVCKRDSPPGKSFADWQIMALRPVRALADSFVVLAPVTLTHPCAIHTENLLVLCNAREVIQKILAVVAAAVQVECISQQ